MKNEEYKNHDKGRLHRGEGYKRKDKDSHHRGAKTFRRGRAIAFLEMMNVKRSTIMKQLEAPEFQSINQVLVGELKAIDMIINEFVQLFELHEMDAIDSINKTEEEEISSIATKDSLDNNQNEMD
ncbi:hypothetical protein [Bacillus sp. UNC41MFS5]|uniref:hypothetical protein n=1 Tax=Bacillus sp. UNC41MFS5 TaxID=1449046 RepID=UPI00047A0970|nr:hypothetical protein [Bacillus sp. UNC41MFS5]